MKRVTIIDAEYSGWKIKLDGTTVVQVPNLETAKLRAEVLCRKNNEKCYAIINNEDETIVDCE